MLAHAAGLRFLRSCQIVTPATRQARCRAAEGLNSLNPLKCSQRLDRRASRCALCHVGRRAAAAHGLSVAFAGTAAPGELAHRPQYCAARWRWQRVRQSSHRAPPSKPPSMGEGDINGCLPVAAARRRAPAIYSTLPCALALHRGAVGVARRPTNAGQNQARCPSRRRGASSHRSEGRRLPRKLGQVALRREGEGGCCAQAVNLARSAAQLPYNLLPCEFNASVFCGLMALWHERWNNVVHRAFS